MAIKRIPSVQLGYTDVSQANRKYPIDDHGKRRDQYAFAVNTVDAGDPVSTFDLFILPPGRVRLLPPLIRLKNSAFGAGRLLSLGHRAYMRSSQEANIPEDATAFVSGIDVSAASVAAGVGAPSTAPFKYDLYSKQGVIVFAAITGGTIPVGASIEVLAPYIYE